MTLVLTHVCWNYTTELIYVLYVSFFRGTIESNVNRNDLTELSTRWSISLELGFLKNLLLISADITSLNVIGIISLNLATALSGRHLEN